MKLGDKRTMVECLHASAAIAAAKEQSSRCAVLSGAAEALHAAISVPPSPAERAVGEPALATARGDLGDEAFEAAFAEGRALAVDEAVKCALQPLGNPTPSGATRSGVRNEETRVGGPLRDAVARVDDAARPDGFRRGGN